jgi:hypothetical protein
MPNLFFVSHAKRFMFLSVSKNACSSLKLILHRLEYGRDFRPGAKYPNIHTFWGFSEWTGKGTKIDRRSKRKLSRHSDYLRFAVYRDPVDRFLSLYHNKVLWPPAPNPYYTGLRLEGLALDPFLDVVEEALLIRNPLRIDEHIRPQNRYYTEEDVEYIVPIDALTDFLAEKFGVTDLPRGNKHKGVRIAPSEAQLDRIRTLYREDYDLVPNYPG